MFTFIAGIQSKTRVLEDKRQPCPACGKVTLQKQRVDHMLSVFFIPLFPVERGEPFFACPECGPPSCRPGSCPDCGRRVERDFIYCPGCGRRL